jgi:hypothetical protein
MTQPQLQEQERSLGALLGELAQQTSTVVKDEVQLAKLELTQKAVEAGRNAGLVGAGTALLHAGLLAVLAAIVVALGHVIPVWLAALLVGIAVGGAGYALAQKGMSALRRIELAPKDTLRTLEEDKLWVQSQVR